MGYLGGGVVLFVVGLLLSIRSRRSAVPPRDDYRR